MGQSIFEDILAPKKVSAKCLHRSSHSHCHSFDTWAKGHNQPPLFYLLLLVVLLTYSSVATWSYLSLSKALCLIYAHRTSNWPKFEEPPISPLSALRNRVRSASADKGKPGQTPVAQGGDAAHVPVHVRIHWHESVFVTFCKDFLLLSNEFVIKQKLKPQISKLTHVPFCTDLQTWVWWLNFKGAVYATLQMCGFSVPDPKRMSEQKKPNWQWY